MKNRYDERAALARLSMGRVVEVFDDSGEYKDTGHVTGFVKERESQIMVVVKTASNNPYGREHSYRIENVLPL